MSVEYLAESFSVSVDEMDDKGCQVIIGFATKRCAYFSLFFANFIGIQFIMEVSAQENGFMMNEAAHTYDYHLTNSELFYLFGRMNNLPVYEVLPLSPVAIPKRRKRWLLPNENLRLNLTVLNSNLFLEVWPNPQLTAPSLVVVKRTENGTEIPVPSARTIVEPHCYYHGRVLRKDSKDHDSTPEFDGIVALDLCEGYSGIIATSKEHLVIRPIPVHGVSKRSVRNAGGLPHLIYRHDFPPGLHDCPSREIHQGPDSPDGQTRGSRSIISLTSIMVIETAIFIDRDLYEIVSGIFPNDADAQTIKIVLTMANAVQLVFNHRSLDNSLHLPIIRLEMLDGVVKGLDRPKDIDKFLTSFCQWQKGINPALDLNPHHWDHALILTGLNLYTNNGPLPLDDRVVGLAPVSGMCIPGRSCTVNEGRHFEAVYVVAHEIGHSLGMQHDGQPHNNCDPESYIMSATLGGGKTSWSPCSSDYLQNFLSSPHAQCLRDSNGTHAYITETSSPGLPGQRHNADQQCRLKFGTDSRRSRLHRLQDSCHDLICQIGPSGEEAYAHPALEGTSCGPGKWCREGECVWKHHLIPDEGWSNWSDYSGCASGCLQNDNGQSLDELKGVQSSSRQCERTRNSSGKCQGVSRRHKLCDAQSLCASAEKKTITDFARRVCLKAAQNDKSLTGEPLPSFQQVSPHTKCLIQCSYKNGTSAISSTMYPDGTPCELFDQSNSYCVNGRCTAFKCDLNKGCIDEDSRSSKWQTASKCHSSCITGGKGIRLVRSLEGCTPQSSRTCGKSNLQLCEVNQESCPKVQSVQEFATSVCSLQAQEVNQIGPWGVQLPSVPDDPHRPCIVACRDAHVSSRYYKMDVDSSGWFPTGTKCEGSGSNTFCVQGKCKHFGEDGILQDQDQDV